MIRSKSFLFLSLSLICFAAILSWPFPDNPLIGMRFAIFGIPITTDHGYDWMGLSSVIILLAGLILLGSSLKSNRLLAGIAALLVFMFVPPVLTETYQTTLATGIYAVSANSDDSTCDFSRDGESEILNGVCRINFTNHSREEVTFQLLFTERYHDDGIMMMALMNLNGPLTVSLPPDGETTIEFEETIDTSEIPNAIYSGSASGLELKIFDDEKERDL
ncbi:MAG TPA: hypothetical protein VK947_05335 [Planococcus sp. (in: firmicutes)]|nr:hypothetical protein [Planococcus sp. (in: firmicutes)]